MNFGSKCLPPLKYSQRPHADTQGAMLLRQRFCNSVLRGREDKDTNDNVVIKVWHHGLIRSGKTDPVVSNRALFAYKNGRFASRFLLLGIGFSEALKKANLSFKSPSPEPHLIQTGPVFARPT